MATAVVYRMMDGLPSTYHKTDPKGKH